MRAIAVAAAIFVLTTAPAYADPDNTDASGHVTEGGLAANLLDHSGTQSAPHQAHGAATPTGPSFLAGNAACPGAIGVFGAQLDITLCSPEPKDQQPALTVGVIRSAFAELKLPAGELVVQPPDGLTLVNFATNFYTTSTRPITRTVTLLGRAVTLEATPATFHWTFGDGARLTTTDPGAPYPRLRVTHSYLRTGTYRPALATTYTGRFRVGAGPWRAIPGTVTIAGAGQALRAIEAQPKLVRY